MPKVRLLKLYRQQAVLSQRELAERAGLTKRTIVNLELGRTSAHPATVRKLAQVLGVAPDELAGT